MSYYVFVCLDCKEEFSERLLISEFEKGGIKCPKCGGSKVTQKVEAFAAVTSRKS